MYVCPLIDIWVISTFWLISGCECWCTIPLQIPSFRYFSRSGMSVSYHNSVFHFWRTTLLFSKAGILFCIPTSNAEGFHYHQKLLFSGFFVCLFSFLVIVILLNVKYFIVVLIYISLMISDVENLFLCLLAIWYLLWRNVYLYRHLTMFNQIIFCY